MVGSLKKGSKQSMSLPSTAYNTLPAHVHHMRSTTSSPRVIAGQQQNKKHHHKRSPSSDSGTGSNTPVSSYHSGKVHHTVFLHGMYHKCMYKYKVLYCICFITFLWKVNGYQFVGFISKVTKILDILESVANKKHFEHFGKDLLLLRLTFWKVTS